jgi:hypothetical protein
MRSIGAEVGEMGPSVSHAAIMPKDKKTFYYKYLGGNTRFRVAGQFPNINFMAVHLIFRCIAQNCHDRVLIS